MLSWVLIGFALDIFLDRKKRRCFDVFVLDERFLALRCAEKLPKPAIGARPASPFAPPDRPGSRECSRYGVYLDVGSKK